MLLSTSSLPPGCSAPDWVNNGADCDEFINGPEMVAVIGEALHVKFSVVVLKLFGLLKEVAVSDGRTSTALNI
jgi:hypothetical protein